jgi:hypothetical protein
VLGLPPEGTEDGDGERAVRRTASVALGAAAAIALALSACGGADDDASAGGGGGISEADVQDAGVKYARCMREQGIEMPDPQPGLGGLRGLMTDQDLERQPGFRKAEGDCRKHLAGLTSQISDEQRSEILDARLEFARCMRDQGFDVPDPQPGGGDGGGGGGPLGELDFEDPRVQAAMDECRVDTPSVLDDR